MAAWLTQRPKTAGRRVAEAVNYLRGDGTSVVNSYPNTRTYQPSPMSQKQLEERTAWVYDEQTFPVWNASFEKSDRTEMIRDDLWAGRSISILLATLVAVGLILAGVTINFVVNWR